jgi:hypothetical protein
MLSTATSCGLVAAAFVFSLGLAPAWGKDNLPPRVLQEPVFGLRFEAAKAGFEILPNDVAPKCMEYAGTKSWGVGKLFVFASTRDADQTYYVVGGYWERRIPKPSESRYERDKYGGVIAVNGENCIGLGRARDVFDARYFKEIPQPVLQRLADDLANRLLRAYGTSAHLRDAFERQHIKRANLPVELQSAFEAFFPH